MACTRQCSMRAGGARWDTDDIDAPLADDCTRHFHPKSRRDGAPRFRASIQATGTTMNQLYEDVTWHCGAEILTPASSNPRYQMSSCHVEGAIASRYDTSTQRTQATLSFAPSALAHAIRRKSHRSFSAVGTKASRPSRRVYLRRVAPAVWVQVQYTRRQFHLLKAGLVHGRLDDGRLRLTGDHAHAFAHALHSLDDVILPHVVDDTHHLRYRPQAGGGSTASFRGS